MFQPGLPSQFLRNDIHTDITVTDRYGALGPGRFSGSHPEQSFVETAQQYVVVADNREVFDLGEHVGSLWLCRLVVNLACEAALFQFGEQAVVDKIIGVELSGIGNLLAHLIQSESYRASIAVGN